MSEATILQGNCIEVLKTLEAGSVQCIVTSPPYYGLRDYGTAQWEGGDPTCAHAHKRGGNGAASKKQTTSEGTQEYQYKDTCPKCGAVRIDEQIGLEETPEKFVEKLVEVFQECWRVLKDDGTLWVNLGDSYVSSPPGNTGRSSSDVDGVYHRRNMRQLGQGEDVQRIYAKQKNSGLKPKDMIGIPWMVAFALRSAGYYLRRDIIWSKPNPMPESADDRPTTSHEYIFLLTKKSRYFYDNEAIKEPVTEQTVKRLSQDVESQTGSTRANGGAKINGNMKAVGYIHKNLQNDGQKPRSMHIARANGEPEKEYGKRNKRSVWTVTPKPYKEAHFATYPEDLIEPCILAGTSARGECPTCGTAWERVTDTEYVYHEKWFGEKNNNLQDVRHSRGSAGNGYNEPIGTTTLGWRPRCTCYGLDLIADPPTKPNQGQNESDEIYTERLQKWEEKKQEWKEKWWKLKPLYDACETVPQTVLDPFNGSGTTGAVSLKHRRRYTGIDLNPKYIKLSHRRLAKVQPVLFGVNP